MVSPPYPPAELIPETDTQFALATSASSVEFTVDGSGNVTAISVYDGGGIIRAGRRRE